MKFGIFGGATARGAQPGAPPPEAAARPRYEVSYSDDSHGYQAFVQSVIKAEAMGFHSLFLVEHHFTGRIAEADVPEGDASGQRFEFTRSRVGF